MLVTRIISIIMILCGMQGKARAMLADTLTLDLEGTIRLAHGQSPSAQSARNTFLTAYWQYRYFRADYLPSVTLSSSPYINRQINKIAQADGSDEFRQQEQFGADLSLKINQNIAFTGGSLFVKSTLNRLDELHKKTTAYSTQPLIVGYEQSLFGYNSLKWNRRIEPIRYREAKKQYVETLELLSAKACSYFFSLMMAQKNLEMAQRNFASADTLFQMAKGRYTIGTITENEMLQLEINRLNEETNVMDAEIQVKEAMQSFRSFLNLEQGAEIKLTLTDSVPQFVVPLQKALELAHENSPDPDHYQLQKKEGESSLAVAKANAGLRADLYVQLGLSQTGRDVSQAYRNLENQQYASISVSLPILDWGRGKGRVKVAKSQLELINTNVEQGMKDFNQNVQKTVMQFNMQARKVHIAMLTDKRAEQRHAVARKLYVMGRSSILDLNAAISERNSARRNYINTIYTYWQLYYLIRSMTGYDFLKDEALTLKELKVKN